MVTFMSDKASRRDFIRIGGAAVLGAVVQHSTSALAGDFSDTKTYGVNVRQTGAVGDGQADDGKAIQDALDSGAPLVVIPAGIYRIGNPLRVGSNTRITAHPRAQIIMGKGVGSDSSSFLLTNKDHEVGNENILVEGGIWNGNNPENPRGKKEDPQAYHGVAIGFHNVQRLNLHNLTVRDPESFHIRLNFVRDFRIDGIRLEDPHIRKTQDGIHVGGGCEDGVICDVSAPGPMSPNDDMIAIQSGDGRETPEAVELTGLKAGAIRRIRVERVSAAEAFAFVRVLSVREPVEDIEIRDVRGGCRYLAIQLQTPSYLRRTLGRQVLGSGNLRRVKVQHCRVYRVDRHSPDPLIHIEQNVQDLVIEDFQRDADRDANPGPPLLLLDNNLPNRVLIEGVRADQVKILDAPPGQTPFAAAPMADLYDRPLSHLAGEIPRGSKLELRGDTIGLLRVDSTKA